MIKVYYVTRDYGDGTNGVDFFTDKALVERLVENEEEYFMNEGIDSFSVPNLGNIPIKTAEDFE